MEFNLINLAGGIVVVLVLVPNIIYALRTPGAENKCKNKWMNLLEQVGRYACMALMVLPLGVWEFGFSGVAAMLAYGFGNAGLLMAYWVSWRFYFRKVTAKRAIMLAVLPTGIFLLSGLALGHPLLILAAIAFGMAHVYVTRANYR